MLPPELTTPRTTLTRLQACDAGFLLELTRSPGYLKYIGDRGLTDEASARDYIRQYFLSCWEQHGFGYYLVSDQAGQPMGMCGFLQRDYFSHPDLGFAFMPQVHRQGFAMEVSQALMSLAARTDGLQELNAVTNQENAPSMALLRKLGFEQIDFPSDESALADSTVFRWRA